MRKEIIFAILSLFAFFVLAANADHNLETAPVHTDNNDNKNGKEVVDDKELKPIENAGEHKIGKHERHHNGSGGRKTKKDKDLTDEAALSVTTTNKNGDQTKSQRRHHSRKGRKSHKRQGLNQGQNQNQQHHNQNQAKNTETGETIPKHRRQHGKQHKFKPNHEKRNKHGRSRKQQ